MAKVWKDAQGIFVRAGGYEGRPGGVPGYDHAYRMDEGGLKEGDQVKAAHVAGTQLIRLRLADGSKIYWGCTPYL